MKLINMLLLVITFTMTTAAFAAEQIAKEETTPPPAENALALNQIPPLGQVEKPDATKPAAKTSS